LNYIKPLFLSGITAIKNQAAETGKAVINELGRKPLRNIIQEQSKIALQNLSNKAINKFTRFQSVSGKRNKRLGYRKKRLHYISKRQRKHTKTQHKKKSTSKLNIKDIFSNAK